MALPAFRKVQTTDPNLNEVQNQLKQIFDQLQQILLLNGTYLANKPLVIGSNLLSHGLGRNYNAIFQGLQRIDGYSAGTYLNLQVGTLYESPSPDRSQFINITSTSNTTVSLWVI